VNKFIKFLLIFIFTTSCSYNKNSRFWSTEKINKETQENKEEISVVEKYSNVEFNPSLKINIRAKAIDKSFINNYDNNNGRINYDGNLKNISKFKFSKINNFYQYEPNISFDNNNVIFFDNKGTILKFDENSKLIWKKNYYLKSEKKLQPILFFDNNKKILIVADNIAKYYALDIKSGQLLWSKNNIAPFNSQLKIYKDKFFIIDFKNTLRAFSIKDGTEIWNIKTENSLIRSQKKLSMVIIKEKIYFNNSLGDISAVDIKSGELLWQIPTQSSLIFDSFFRTSDIIADNKNLYFSNNQNQFYSVNINNGLLNWTQKINSNLRATLIDNYLFTVSLDGYLLVIEKKLGNIIRSTDIFKNFNPKKRSKIKPVGFIIGKKNIYLTTDNGRLLIIDTQSGLTTLTLKIDNDKISRPYVLNQNLYIIKDNSIIKLN
tara:strand:+ start:498 stop:1793 length:1296 start_codon:yes stop_codon:yes gene_type:complete